MKISRQTYNELKERLNKLEKLVNGGKGSGNFGHAGRLGERGGSAPEGSGGDIKTNLREGYGRFSQAKLDEDDFSLPAREDKGKILSRVDGEAVRDVIFVKAVASQLGEQEWRGKLDGIKDPTTKEYAETQRQLARDMVFVAEAILDGVTTSAGIDYLQGSRKDADAKMARLSLDMRGYDTALTKLGEAVYKGANEQQSKMLRENDKVLQASYDKLEKAYRKYTDASGNAEKEVDISDLIKPRR